VGKEPADYTGTGVKGQPKLSPAEPGAELALRGKTAKTVQRLINHRGGEGAGGSHGAGEIFFTGC
jgi:hypothetical protein